MAFQKDTIRLIVQFKDFNGKTIVPDDVKLTIYKEDESLIETISTNITKLSDKYYHDYIVPEYNFIFEYSGVYQELPVIARRKVETKFI